jgi:hypothetical protein
VLGFVVFLKAAEVGKERFLTMSLSGIESRES